MNRRNAVKAFLFGMGSFSLWPRCATSETLTIPVEADFAKLREQVRALRDPDYIPEVRGVLGKTYFKCGMLPRFKHHWRLHFNGVDVTNCCNECDEVGGWVRLWDEDAAGHRLTRLRTYFGKVCIIPL